jgi:hypothetical protein
MSNPYGKYTDPRWQKLRLEVLEKWDFSCACCGNKKKELHVHHIQYKKNSKIWEYENFELIALCSQCHEKLHYELDEIQQLITTIITQPETENCLGVFETIKELKYVFFENAIARLHNEAFLASRYGK